MNLWDVLSGFLWPNFSFSCLGRILEFTADIHVELWFSNLIMHPSQLENLLEYRFLSPNTQSFCVRIQKVWGEIQFCTYKFPGNVDAIDLGTTLWELLTSINDQ